MKGLSELGYVQVLLPHNTTKQKNKLGSIWQFWPSSGNYSNKLPTSNQIQKNKKKANPVIKKARKKNGRKDINFIHQWLEALVLGGFHDLHYLWWKCYRSKLFSIRSFVYDFVLNEDIIFRKKLSQLASTSLFDTDTVLQKLFEIRLWP